MNFFERNKQKLAYLIFVIYCLIIALLSYIFENVFSGLPSFAFIIFMLPPVISYFVYESYAKKKRANDLREYAEKNNYNFYEKPDEDQISLFKEFSSTKTMNNQDKFFNLLVPKDDNSPSIVTGKSVIGGGESSTTYFTQIFLYKQITKTELPKFYVQRKTKFDTFLGERREHIASHQSGIKLYKFKKKDFPHNKYFFFSENPDIENFITNEFIELLKTGIIKKKALINIESNGKNLIFYKQWSRHSTESMEYYSNLFNALKESLIL